MIKPLLLSVFLLLTVPAFAQVAAPSDLNKGARPERGWFFFDDPKKKEPEPEKEKPKAQLPAQLPPPPKEEVCTKKETWSPDCGFVNPGEDFAFQEKQRDSLMQRMSLAKNDPKAVEDFQYYMRWVIERTSEVTNNWWYNMVQNPDLDPNVKSPISAFGLRLMTEVRQGRDKEIFELIKSEGGFLVYFSRHDCTFCHQMSETIKRLGERTGLEVRNAALDEKCMPGLEKGCVTAPKTLIPAQMLQVSTVPTVFLYIPKNTWIRVGTGVVDTESMVTRTAQFFSAYRTALVNGTQNGTNGRASVDFTGATATGTSTGIEGASTAQAITPPTQEEVSKMLGAAPKPR